LKNLALWGLGPALTLAGALGAAGAVAMVLWKRDLRFVLPLALAAAVFLFQGPRFVAFMRYFAPMYPALMLLAGWGAVELWKMVRQRDPGEPVIRLLPRHLPTGMLAGVRMQHVRYAVAGLFAIVAIGAVWWALAFQNVYAESHPRIQA